MLSLHLPEYPVHYRRKIRFSDTDLQAVVFNGNYFTYFDDVLTDYFETLGLSESEFGRRGHDITVARAEADFRSAARMGDVLVVGARVESIGNKSMVVGLKVVEEDSGRVVTEGREVYVVLDRETGKSVPVPDYLREAIVGLQGPLD